MRSPSAVPLLIVASCIGPDKTGSDGSSDAPVDGPVDTTPGEDGDADADADADSDADTDVDTGSGTAPCTNPAVAIHPLPGDTDVYYRTSVRFSLDAADPSAVITVADDQGNVVPGTTEVIGVDVGWTGDPLAPSTAYTATLSYECESTIDFTTSTTGEPTEVDLIGTTYALDLSAGLWIEPAGVGALIGTQLGSTRLLVSPVTITPDSLSMLGALGTETAQDLCTPTVDLPSTAYQDPYFELEAPALLLDVGGVEIEFLDVRASGAFSPDGSRIQGGTLAALLDTRELGALFGLPDQAGAVCQLVGTFGVNCIPCSDGAPFCLSMDVEDVPGPRSEGLALEPRTELDILSDPTCSP